MKRYPRRAAMWLALLMLGLSWLGSTPSAQAQWDGCFAETNQCIGGRIREFWEQNGGLPVFGYPIGPQHEENIGGNTYQVQQFERNRLELHPENERPNDVLLGRLGADSFPNNGWLGWPKAIPENSIKYFAATGHRIDDVFWVYWTNRCIRDNPAAQKPCQFHESLRLFGMPVTEAHSQTSTDGNRYWTQYFERARFEYHADFIGTPNEIQLTLLGRVTPAPQFPPSMNYERLTNGSDNGEISFNSKADAGTLTIRVNGGSVDYAYASDWLWKPVFWTNGSQSEVAKGFSVSKFEDQDHININIDTSLWYLAQ